MNAAALAGLRLRRGPLHFGTGFMHRARIVTRLLPLVIVAVTAVVFVPALGHDFVAWDDDLNLTANLHYRGFGLDHLRWMLSERRMTHWFPLTWLSFAADYSFWGMNPAGYHLTNILLHAANAGLVYVLARILLARATSLVGPALRLGATVAALLFALHPLRAEAVAWATARSELLSTLFFLFALWGHLAALDAEGRRRLTLRWASVAAYALAVTSKNIVMTLPVVLILLDVYPLRRLPATLRRWGSPGLRHVWLEKVPYLALGLTAAAIAYVTAAQNGVLTSTDQYPLTARLAMAAYSLVFYLGKTLVPVGLIPLYELPARVDPLEQRFLMSIVTVVIITGSVVALRRRWPAGLALWLAYVFMLAPVSGLVHAGHHLAYDRYSYLACLGWAFLGGAAVAAAWELRARMRPAFAYAAVVAAGVGMLGLGVITVQQVGVWRDTETLWRHAVDVDPACSICRYNLGVALYNGGDLVAARTEFEAALALRPDRAKARLNLGIALLELGEPDRAETELARVVATHPNSTNALNALGVALIKQGRSEAAVPHLERAVALADDDPYARTHLAVALTAAGRPADALSHYRRAIALLPDAGVPRLGLARAHLALGDLRGAREDYETLRTIDTRLAGQLALEIHATIEGGNR